MKQDQRRISGEEWEVDYLRKIAKEILAEANTAAKEKGTIVVFEKAPTEELDIRKLQKLAKAVLKLTKR